jgi:hypothetical protein
MAKKKLVKEKLPEQPKIEAKFTKVIRIAGDLKRAKTADGKFVYRTDSIFFPEYSSYPVKCAPYSVHFIFDDPTKTVGHWSPMCSCGSPAVIIGSNTYTKLMAPTITGDLIVCFTHMATFEQSGHGRHADGMPE